MLTSEQFDILEGLMLGDGHLSIGDRAINPRLRVNRSSLDLAYQEWTATKFASYVTSNGIRTSVVHDSRLGGRAYSRTALVTRRSADFLPSYRRWYESRTKVLPQDLNLTALIVSIWLADDGSIYVRKCGGVEVKFNVSGFDSQARARLLGLLNDRYQGGFALYEYGPVGCIQGATRVARRMFSDIGNVFTMLPRKRGGFIEIQRMFGADHPVSCPRCGVDAIIKNGFYRHKERSAQRYRCSSCGHGYKLESIR